MNPHERLAPDDSQNLLDNALDFLLSAAEAVRRDEGTRSLKEAVLHLGNGVELLVKARLAREHWSLIFSSIDQANYDKLADGEFTSVDFPKAVARLEQIVRVPIDKSIIFHVDNLRKLRNRLAHFTAELDPVQTKSLVAKSMSFCVEFCEQQSMVSSDATGKIGEIQVNLTGFQEFVDDRMKSISEEWKGALIWECPGCWQEALVSDGGEVECKFCKRRFTPQELAFRYSEDVPEDCPHCDAESSFAFVLYTNEDGRWVCFSCGEGGENYDSCVRCYRLTYSPGHDGGIAICDSCWWYIMDQQ